MEGVTLFLCGDVMTGRGVDQILAHPSDPGIQEACMSSAEGYVEIAERASGPIPRAVPPGYIWGDALGELARVAPEARVVNLETAVTCSDERWQKGINYRMHPRNVSCLAAAGIDCCALANNHMLDWGREGLLETLSVLGLSGVATAGAGRNRAEAAMPAALPLERGGRLLVAACATASSGVPADWAAAEGRPGVQFIAEPTEGAAGGLAEALQARRRSGDLVMVSIHWGGNWGYTIAPEERRFARRLVDAGVDLVHGHSSHHPKGMEIHRGRLILYGCGDFLNDYEGIRGFAEYRGELGLMYFPTLDRESGALRRLELVPTRIRRFRVERASAEEARWLCEVLGRESREFGVAVRLRGDGRIEAEPAAAPHRGGP